MALRSAALVAGAFVVTACDVPAPRGSAGATIPDSGTLTEACGRGAVVVEQPLEDYGSTNVGLVAWDGTVLAPSIAGSSTSSVGLTAPLSGDVVPPTALVTGPEIVLIDRNRAASKIVWVNVQTAARRELSVAPGGFYANPHDYVALSETKAYVTRFGSNPAPGAAPLDTGSDVVVVDPSVPKLVASISMTGSLGDDAAVALPRPDRIVVANGRAYVLLGALARGFTSTVPSRLAVVDTARDAVTGSLVLSTYRNCAGLALAPSGKRLSVLCSGTIAQTSASDLADSGVVVVDVSVDPPKIEKTIDASTLGAGPVGFYGDHASDSVLLVQTFGYRTDVPTPDADDTVQALDVETGATTSLLRSGGTPFSLGGIVCASACGTCFVADAARAGGILHRFTGWSERTPEEQDAVKVETDPAYPPETLGRF